MTKKKNIRPKVKKNSSKKDTGLANIATITTKSLSSAFLNFKNQVYLGDNGVYFLTFLVAYLII